MPCQAPIPAWRPANGGPLLFKEAALNGHAYNRIEVPCGTCILCREEQARQAAVRIYHESQQYADNSFITLTYADKHLPKHNSLNYEHLTEFWNRLRALVRRRSKKDRTILPRLRYYAVGEYGDRTLRPHYHACIFGHAFLHQRVILRTTPTLLWTQPDLIQAWRYGHVSVGDLNFATARYTAQYICKKLRSKQKYVTIDTETGELVALEQPRAFMSKNIGKDWWAKWHQQTIDHDHVVIGGRPQKPPKAYDKWLKQASPPTIEKIKEERRRKAVANATGQVGREARAKNSLAKRKQQKKTI